MGLCNLHHRSIRVQNWGFHFFGSSQVSGPGVLAVLAAKIQGLLLRNLLSGSAVVHRIWGYRLGPATVIGTFAWWEGLFALTEFDLILRCGATSNLLLQSNLVQLRCRMQSMSQGPLQSFVSWPARLLFSHWKSEPKLP